MATMLLHQQQNVDVITTMSRDMMSRDVMTSGTELAFNDSLLLQSFYDVIDTSQLCAMTSDDSGVYNCDEWSPGIPPSDPDYDAIARPMTVTSAGNPHYDVIEDTPCSVTSPSPVWSVGIPADVIRETRCASTGSLSFTDEQIACICVALQQKRDIDKLDSFLSTLARSGHSRLQPYLAHHSQITPRSRETCDDDLLPVTSGQPASQAADELVDAVLSSVAHVAFHRGRYQQLYATLQSHTFAPVYHGCLQQLWYEAQYDQQMALRGRPLSAVDKYRIRRKHPLPTTIWDGEHTIYCFKVSQRHLATVILPSIGLMVGLVPVPHGPYQTANALSIPNRFGALEPCAKVISVITLVGT